MIKNDKLKVLIDNYDFKEDNEIVNEIIEKKLSSNFLILNEEKIIHTSTEYNLYKGIRLDKKTSVLVKKDNISGKQLSFKINKKYILNGPVFFSTFKNEGKKGMLIIKYNKKRFTAENIEIIYYLSKYIKL